MDGLVRYKVLSEVHGWCVCPAWVWVRVECSLCCGGMRCEARGGWVIG